MKRILSGLLACLLLAATPMALAEERAREGNLYLEGYPVVEEPVTFKVMIAKDNLSKQQPEDLKLYKAREEKSRVCFVYDTVPSTAVNERKATTFASGDYPDVFMNILNDSDVLTYGTAGALLPLEGYFEKYMPSFTKVMEDVTDTRKRITMPDGHIYGVPQINFYSTWPGDGVYIRTSQLINKTWLDKLNLAMPTTTEELVEVLRAFQTGDPNGNGQADEIPYSFVYGSGWAENMGESLYGPFGILGPCKYLNVQDGKAFYPMQDARYLDAIRYIRTLYAQGLIDPEAFTQDNARYRAKGNAETAVYGMFNAWTGDVEVGTARIKGENPEYVYMPPFKGPNGAPIWRNDAAGINTNKINLSATTENPEILLRWADMLFDADESVQEVWGMYGQACEKMEDGRYLRVPADPEGTMDTFMQLRQAMQ
ncbi:MAG: extracellular solute-binding protein, partial [Clostridia bacterium]